MSTSIVTAIVHSAAPLSTQTAQQQFDRRPTWSDQTTSDLLRSPVGRPPVTSSSKGIPGTTIARRRDRDPRRIDEECVPGDRRDELNASRVRDAAYTIGVGRIAEASRPRGWV